MVWTVIPNANLAAGAPIRSVDTLALRDNTYHIFNDTLNLSAGDIYQNLGNGSFAFGDSNNTYTAIGPQHRVFRGGTFRFRASIYHGYYGATVTYGWRIYRNGSAVGTEILRTRSSGSDIYETVSFGDISLSEGDIIQIFMRSGNPGFAQCSVFQVGTSVTPRVCPIGIRGENAQSTTSYIPL